MSGGLDWRVVLRAGDPLPGGGMVGSVHLLDISQKARMGLPVLNYGSSSSVGVVREWLLYPEHVEAGIEWTGPRPSPTARLHTIFADDLTVLRIEGR